MMTKEGFLPIFPSKLFTLGLWWLIADIDWEYHWKLDLTCVNKEDLCVRA